MSPKFPNEVYSEQNILIASRQVKWEDTSLLVAASPLNVKMLLLSLFFFCEVYVHLSISDRALCSTRRDIASQLARATRSSKNPLELATARTHFTFCAIRFPKLVLPFVSG